jgi:hypothetical protein
VGGGKSALARELANHLRRQLPQKVAVIDLDIVYTMLRQHDAFVAALPYLQQRTIVIDAERKGSGELARIVATQLG